MRYLDVVTTRLHVTAALELVATRTRTRYTFRHLNLSINKIITLGRPYLVFRFLIIVFLYFQVRLSEIDMLSGIDDTARWECDIFYVHFILCVCVVFLCVCACVLHNTAKYTKFRCK